jgi:ribonuclease P protein component
MVLIALPNSLNQSRFGFAVSRRIGKAVQRNKIKRRMREAARLRQEQIQSGWDLLFIARAPISQVKYQEIDQSMYWLLKGLNLFKRSERLLEE